MRDRPSRHAARDTAKVPAGRVSSPSSPSEGGEGWGEEGRLLTIDRGLSERRPSTFRRKFLLRTDAYTVHLIRIGAWAHY